MKVVRAKLLIVLTSGTWRDYDRTGQRLIQPKKDEEEIDPEIRET
jgi:hypothetical protein